jgi:hypothetical protein
VESEFLGNFSVLEKYGWILNGAYFDSSKAFHQATSEAEITGLAGCSSPPNGDRVTN